MPRPHNPYGYYNPPRHYHHYYNHPIYTIQLTHIYYTTHPLPTTNKFESTVIYAIIG